MDFDPEILNDRGSAFIGLLLGCIVLGAGLYAVTSGHTFRLAITALVLGPAIVVVSAVKLQTIRRMPGRLLSGGEARALVAIQRLPFWVCTRCNALHEQDAGECLHCNRRVDYLEVASEQDRETTLAAIALD